MNKTFYINSQDIKNNAFDALALVPTDGTHELIIRDKVKDKTIKQLGAIFGNWVNYLAVDGKSKKEIHQELKKDFLQRIYLTDPIGDMQEQWVELYFVYQLTQNWQKLNKHAQRISLSWTNLKQTKQYMADIESHYQDIGNPLPIIDKYWNVK